MLILTLFAVLAGVVTILSPCILPILPILLSSTADKSGKRRPIGIVLGFVTSFTFFTLFLSSLVIAIGIGADVLRMSSVVVLGLFGLSLVVHPIQEAFERIATRLTARLPASSTRGGLGGGLLVGLSLGILWTPCVGPILAAVISLALVGTVTAQAFIITLAYAFGTAVPMFIILQAGSAARQKIPWLVQNAAAIQQSFGVVMLATAIAIFFNLDRRFQTFVLTTFPQYGTSLTQLEDIPLVQTQLQERFSGKNTKSSTDSLAPEIVGGQQWFNLPSTILPVESLQLAQLRGKVVLLDFWTYSCINCQRTLPYLQNWWEKYQDDGLVIIGIHSPEFEFEKNPGNVAEAIADFGLSYPTVQDNEFAIWRAYSNRYWPAKYLIDAEGLIRYTHFGEGKYDETERVIQNLLKEAGSIITDTTPDNPTYQNYAQTHETYLGYARMDSLASPERVVRDSFATYSSPSKLPNDAFSLAGSWRITSEFSQPAAGAQLYLNFASKKVFLVALPSSDDSAEIIVSLDGREERLEVAADKLYTVVDLPDPGRHTLKLTFPTGSVALYAFTFG
ncbi:MAG: cytochrome c biogenesis protein DipZ [Candidatus Pacebacteria bacterium]|nr:cytochrome c biogenesis protein DipZ [Candidatus Paceibacterota bacterium]PIR60389.1 MAG: hypothetical protein COU67_02435 [Candidatus Pacebacteria bacterium CG10_big_fil_rev_8_21_14_0_10_44_54]